VGLVLLPIFSAIGVALQQGERRTRPLTFATMRGSIRLGFDPFGGLTAMDHTRLVVRLLISTGLLVFAGFGAPSGQPTASITEPAKVGFSYLSTAQLKELWRLTENYAMAEVFLRQCGSPPHIESRMRVAARDCVEASALNRVAAYFRRKVTELTGRQAFVCDTEQAKALVKTTRAKVDAAVAEVYSMCRACLFC